MRILLAIPILFWIHCTSARADLLDDAIQAYRTGIPEVSITKLRQFLASQPAPDRAHAAGTLLAQCLIETGKTEEAAKILEKSTGPEATFLKAQEAFRSRRGQAAADWFASLITTSTRYSVEARLGLADSQKALGESEA